MTNSPLRLPESCYVVMPGFPAGRNVCIAQREVAGVTVTRLDFGEEAQARPVVRALNELADIAPVVEHAMLAGAMFGWDSPAADPNHLIQADHRFMHTA